MPRLIQNILLEIERWTALPGWAQIDKMTDAAELIVRERPGLMVEIGVYGGRMLMTMGSAARLNSYGVVYGIDPYSNEASQEGTNAESEKKLWAGEDLERRYQDLQDLINREGLHHWAVLLRKKSEETRDYFADESIGLIHIDGNHSPEVSTRDVRLYLPKVKPGGYVWLDDTNWKEVQDALRLAKEQCDVVKEYNTHQLLRKR